MIDQEISAKYHIVPYGVYAMEVQRFGWKVNVFHKYNDREKNWNDAVVWCGKYYELIPAGPPATIRGYRTAFKQRDYFFKFSPVRMCWVMENKGLDVAILLCTQDDVKEAIKEILE